MCVCVCVCVCVTYIEILVGIMKDCGCFTDNFLTFIDNDDGMQFPKALIFTENNKEHKKLDLEYNDAVPPVSY